MNILIGNAEFIGLCKEPVVPLKCRGIALGGCRARCTDRVGHQTYTFDQAGRATTIPKLCTAKLLIRPVVRIQSSARLQTRI